MAFIHPSAVVESGAQLADDVVVGPMSYVGPDVVIGSGTKLMAQCHISGDTTIGENNVFYPFCSVGTPAEDVAYCGGKCMVKIGNNGIFREGITINAGTNDGTATVLGNHVFLMANAHVAHNCILGNNVIIVCGSMLAGYVEVQDRAFISGLCGIHQFCRVGRLSILSGGSLFSKDIPPFMMAEGRNGGVKMINLVGLKRAGFSAETIRVIQDLYKIVFRSGLLLSKAYEKCRSELPPIPEVQEFLEFAENSKRGILTNRETCHRN
ncbi:MAG: acyl-ACP--UDP-N-acetylglucosamine O-acyltransferase [Victivallaceae bacterium]|nr:acyl-ACP--UDP-N-acetylglucosamine O-acyltransferase [Victivallaceae bacterium]MDD3703900.1 acyl-ACP--UDP-N-acetylglucosamine O-acyltransferase [Victivallaceae bacterium]MDD5663665.1 acyl-ACP--UDP-N-acetylglucosamine O-acyltransferase [Victivallaceae bacterium]